MEAHDVIKALLRCTEYQAKVLLTLYSAAESMSRTEIAERSGIPRSKIYASVEELMAAGYLSDLVDGKTTLNEGLFEDQLKAGFEEVRDLITNLWSLRKKYIDEQVAFHRQKAEELTALRDKTGMQGRS